MKVTVEISEKEMEEVMRYSGLRKKGPAIHWFLGEALKLWKRKEMSSKIVSGGWQFEMPSWKEARARERRLPWPQ